MTALRCRMKIEKQHRIFSELVALQDGGMTPRTSEDKVCERHLIHHVMLNDIIERGIDENWSPLDS